MRFHKLCQALHGTLRGKRCPVCGYVIVDGTAIAPIGDPDLLKIVLAGPSKSDAESCGLAAQSLKQIIEQNGPLEPTTAARYIRDAARLLAQVHAQQTVHRGIDPSVLFVGPDGTITLKTRPQEAENTVTAAGVLCITDFLAPEQASGRAIDTRANIYNLGCTLYYLLCGHPPFPDGTLVQRLMQHLSHPPRQLSEVQSAIPAELDTICLRMLAKQPEERYQTAGELARVLDRWLG